MVVNALLFSTNRRVMNDDLQVLNLGRIDAILNMQHDIRMDGCGRISRVSALGKASGF
jgi:hypothetical protein